MCDGTPVGKKNDLSIILKGAALSRFTQKGTECQTYEKGMMMLRSWYNSADKQILHLAEWQGMGVSNAMRKKPDESKVTVF